VFLYSFLEHTEKVPEMPGKVLLLLKSLNIIKLKPVERHAGCKDKHPRHTHAWLKTSSMSSLSYSLPLYFKLSIIALETYPVNIVLLYYIMIHVAL